MPLEEFFCHQGIKKIKELKFGQIVSWKNDLEKFNICFGPVPESNWIRPADSFWMQNKYLVKSQTLSNYCHLVSFYMVSEVFDNNK